eukprot:Phypoly_transcript_09602.p1 GENE.Phypoly_transcript_09602~~Phypoly_transcript_09602.p1  ORF type:complete len:183 (+),score=21.01 Phypoly_transcript_09602:811-1359(+)
MNIQYSLLTDHPVFPPSLTYIHDLFSHNCNLDLLPPTLTIGSLSHFTTTCKCKTFPPSITEISFTTLHGENLPLLPSNLTHLTLDADIKDLPPLPNKLKELVLHRDLDTIGDLPPSLTHLDIEGCDEDEMIGELPLLEYLSCPLSYIKCSELPGCLEELVIRGADPPNMFFTIGKTEVNFKE